MTPMRSRQAMVGPDMMAMQAPSPMQFAPPPPMPPPDASGAQAIGGLANMAMALQGKFAGPADPMSNAGQMRKATDAPMRRKTPFSEAAAQPNYA